MKKTLALLLALVMLLSLAACGGGNDNNTNDTPITSSNSTPSNDNSNSAPATGSDLEPVTLKMWLHGTTAAQPEAVEKVLGELNAYLQEKINVTLDPIYGTWGDFDTGVKTALAGGDDVDIYFTCNWSTNEYNKYARDGYWVKLDDLLPTYAPELLETVPEGIWECAKTNGASGKGVYAVPGLKDTATQNCWNLNGTLLAELLLNGLAEELGYEAPTEDNVGELVDTICAGGIDYYSDDFEAMLRAAKALKGSNFYPMAPEPVVLCRMVNHSSIIAGDANGGIMLSYIYDAEHPSQDTGHQIVCTYEMPEFKKYVERTYYLSQQGYIAPDCQSTATAGDARTAATSTGDYLFSTQSYSFGCELEYSAAWGIDVRMIPETAPYMDSTAGQGAMMAISVTSKNPERALMFLNLLNTDPYVMTTLNYGVEGYTYNKNSDGTISFIKENRDNYTMWTNGMGNIRILPPTDDQGVDFWDRFSAFYDSAEVLPYGSFIFDNSPYENEIGALSNVYEKYAFDLMAGTANPAEKLDDFLSELKSAGIDTYVAGVQQQMVDYMNQ